MLLYQKINEEDVCQKIIKTDTATVDSVRIYGVIFMRTRCVRYCCYMGAINR